MEEEEEGKHRNIDEEERIEDEENEYTMMR